MNLLPQNLPRQHPLLPLHRNLPLLPQQNRQKKPLHQKPHRPRVRKARSLPALWLHLKQPHALCARPVQQSLPRR